MNIAIIGTRGIPNNYGGFEQLASFLSQGLVQKGCEVTVYSPHTHPYQEKVYNGVNIVHCYDAEGWLGAAGQFVYDCNCIRHARRHQFDIILFLGYTSSSVWYWLYPKKPVIVYNMDGLEWKRSKYGKLTRQFLCYAEKLAIRHSNYFIADSPAIQQYLRQKFDMDSCYIPYGAGAAANGNETVLAEYGLAKGSYCMLLARMEPENNIAMILEGFCSSSSDMQMLVVGNTGNAFGKLMQQKFANDKRVCFAGPVYDAAKLYTLRNGCHIYFHGHSVGGTNPSLLEAMADAALIAAHSNEFNRAILQQDGYYFSSAAAVTALLENNIDGADKDRMIAANLQKIKTIYNWPSVIEQYHQFFNNICKVND
jgi:glycosyltransferase involved in cell wall biosynthesis